MKRPVAIALVVLGIAAVVGVGYFVKDRRDQKLDEIQADLDRLHQEQKRLEALQAESKKTRERILRGSGSATAPSAAP